MNRRLRDEHAGPLALAVIDIFRSLLREEEIGLAFEEVLSLVRGGLGDYARAVLLMRKRLRPLESEE